MTEFTIAPGTDHYLRMKVIRPGPGERREAYFYILTGLAFGNVYGGQDDWNRTSLYFNVPIPEAPTESLPAGFRLLHWAPYVTLASIGSDAASDVAGWAVDKFEILNSGWVTSLRLECKIAARSGRDAVWNLAYNISILVTQDPT